MEPDETHHLDDQFDYLTSEFDYLHEPEETGNHQRASRRLRALELATEEDEEALRLAAEEDEL